MPTRARRQSIQLRRLAARWVTAPRAHVDGHVPSWLRAAPVTRSRGWGGWVRGLACYAIRPVLYLRCWPKRVHTLCTGQATTWPSHAVAWLPARAKHMPAWAGTMANYPCFLPWLAALARVVPNLHCIHAEVMLLSVFFTDMAPQTKWLAHKRPRLDRESTPPPVVEFPDPIHQQRFKRLHIDLYHP